MRNIWAKQTKPAIRIENCIDNCKQKVDCFENDAIWHTYDVLWRHNMTSLWRHNMMPSCHYYFEDIWFIQQSNAEKLRIFKISWFFHSFRVSQQNPHNYLEKRWNSVKIGMETRTYLYRVLDILETFGGGEKLPTSGEIGLSLKVENLYIEYIDK